MTVESEDAYRSLPEILANFVRTTSVHIICHLGGMDTRMHAYCSHSSRMFRFYSHDHRYIIMFIDII